MLNSSKKLWRLGAALALLAAGCGGPGEVMEPVADNTVVAQEPLKTPTVRLVSPPVWTAGEMVTVLGSDFVSPDRGSTLLTFSGQFVTASGQRSPVSMTLESTFKTAGKVEFAFEPELPPLGFGGQVGTFTGNIIAQNVDAQSASPASIPVSTSVDVGSSLIIWSVQPQSQACPDNKRINATLDQAKVVLDVEAIGLTAATAYTPLTFSASFISLVIEQLGQQAKQGVPTEVVQKLSSGQRTQLVLDFGHLPDGQVATTMNINLTVTDGLGSELSRMVTLDIGRSYSIYYDGNVKTVETFAPAQVSGCLPGGQYGASFNYSEGTSESRTRSVGYSVNVGISIWVANIGFGFNVGSSVTSGSSTNLGIAGRVQPGQFGVFYRQTQKLLRIGEIEQLDICGARRVVGEARVTDWSWAPDLAITVNGQCPPAPASNLPSAQVFE
jgi:hypothetical protein